MYGQCIKGDCTQGMGTYQYPSGARYVGQFYEGKINGEGVLYFSNGDKYAGQWRDYYRQGEGILTFADGSEYVGDFKKSLFNGKGIMSYTNGDQYRGEWKDNMSHGTGKYIFHFGDRYEGQFQKGQFHGRGIYYFKDGSRYEGEWADNEKHGIGLSYHLDGSTSVMQWEHGVLINTDEEKPRPEPQIAASAPEPEVEHNALKDCNADYCKTGQGFFSYQDGSRYEGDFKNGLPNGEGVCFYANGDRYVGGWRHHTPHGEGVMYFSSGKVYGAEWQHGHPIKELDLQQEVKLRKMDTPVVSDDVRVWALIVGIAHYDHMPSLKYTDDDAYRMYAFLKSPEGGALPDHQIQVLIDDDATRAKIIDAMQDVFLQADENDMVFMYYSGHGLDGSFLPIDFNGYENKLHHKDIKYLLDQSRAKHKLFIADACYSGSFSDKAPSASFHIDFYYKNLAEAQSSTAFMLSSSDREVSLEGGGLRQGIFTHYLLKGMKGEADRNVDQVVQIKELYDYVHRNVRKYTNNRQTPILSGNYNKNMPVAVVREPSF